MPRVVAFELSSQQQAWQQHSLSIIQMPPGIPVATVGVNGAQNAAILAVEMLALGDEAIAQRLADYKAGLKEKIVKANKELADVHYEYKTN